MDSKKFMKYLFIVALVVGCFTSCKKDDSGAIPNVSNLKLDPDSAAANTMLTLTGSQLSGIYKIYFDKDSIPASFNPNFNTDNALLFRVPDTAVGGDQNIVFIKANGASFKIPFKVIGKPVVSSVSNYDYNIGDQIVLTGNNLSDVSSVVLSGTTTSVEIIAATQKTLTVKMPSNTMSRSKLDITNSSGMITTTQEFVNISLAYALFTDNFQNNVVQNTWGSGAISTTVYKTGTASYALTYGKGNWSANGFANWTQNSGIPNLQSQGYNYMVFWIKGGSADYTLYLTASTKAGGGYGNSDQTTPVNVSAGVWNYFKLSLSDIKLWANGNYCQQLGWWIKGPDAQDETFYFDDVMFVK